MTSAAIIITCYNLERYVGDAIRSVLAQTFDGEVEIVAVDDCSTDESATIIQSFPEVRYVRTERNSGVLLATLAGIEASGGDVLCFLDGDDLWEPNKLAQVMAAFAPDKRLGLVTHDLIYVDQANAPLDRVTRPSAEMAGSPPSRYSEKIRSGILQIGDYVWLGSAYSVRRSVCDLEGFARFARALPNPANTYQDWPLAYWVAARADVELGYIPEKLFRYRLHQLNHSGDAGTPDKMVRNLARTRNTNEALLEIAQRRNLPRDIAIIVEERIRFCDYLIALYDRRRLSAAAKFLTSAADLRRRKVFAKELLRFCAVSLIGPACFSRLASRRTILRNLPTT